MLKKLLSFAGLLLLALLVFLLTRTITTRSLQTRYEAAAPKPASDSALSRFRAALGYRTISYGNAADWDSLPFVRFHEFLREAYPLMHSRLRLQTVVGYTLWFTWPGADSTRQPVVLMAHQDVVPVEPATAAQWTVDPFGAEVKDGYVWGRGTTDDKVNLVALCEAVEGLLREGYRPARTVHLVFGHDEEIGGTGARAVAERMRADGVEAAFVLDEGGFVTRGQVPGLDRQVALLGTAEKGYLSLELSVEIPGGHSSMPARETAIDILTRAIGRLRAQPLPAKFSEPMRDFMRHLGPEMPFMQRMAFANPAIFRPLIMRTYEASPTGNAMVRTTLVPTILKAGIKDNVVPTRTEATVNLRLLPGDSADAVIARLKAIIADDRVQVRRHSGAFAEASPVSPAKGFGYQLIDRVIKQSVPDVLSTPFLMIGATDSRHFSEVSRHVIKFSPVVDPIGFHGIDERISLESFGLAITFFDRLLRQTD